MTALAAIARRDFVLRRSYRLAFGADLVFVVVDLLLYYFISEVVGPVPAADLGGAPTYFAFAVSGILMSLVLMSATADITNRVREEQLTGTLELLCAQPVRTWELGYGTASFPLAFALVRAGAYLLIAVVALDLSTDSTDWPGVAVMLLTASLAFAPIGVLGAAATIVFKRGGTIAGLIVFAMTFVSGALFPLSLLPDWLQPIGRAMPTTIRVRRASRRAIRERRLGDGRSRAARDRRRCGARYRYGSLGARSSTQSARARLRSTLGHRTGRCCPMRVSAARSSRSTETFRGSPGSPVVAKAFRRPAEGASARSRHTVNCIGTHCDCLYCHRATPETVIGVLGASTPTITGPRSR